MPSTVYDIKLRYSLDDKAAKGLDALEKKAGSTAASAGILSGTLGKLGALAAGGFGVQQAGKALVGFNADVQDTKLQIAGMLALTKKTNLTDELARADQVFANLQRRANTLPGTTAEYAKFAGMITQPIIDAGLSMKDLEDLTVNSVVAAKSLREEAGVAARDIDQALRGMYRSVDPFAGKVLGSIGYKGEEGRKKFNELDAETRASELKRALLQKQWGQLAEGLGQTFTGTLSTVQDTLQQTLGKMGLPLFQAITAELKSWNTWAAANGKTLEKWGADVGAALVDGFRFVKDAVSFLIENKQAIIDIGKVWLAVQAGKAIGGLSSALGGIGDWGKPLKGASGVMGGAGALLGAGMVGWEVGRMIDEATGIGKILMDPVARLAGVWSSAAARQEEQMQALERSMSKMDAAVDAAAERAKVQNLQGAAATNAATRLQGMVDLAAAEAKSLKSQQLAIKAYNESRQNNPFPSMLPVANEQPATTAAAAAALREEELRNKYVVATTNTNDLLQQALSRFTADQRKSIDIQATTQEVMSKMLQAMSGQLAPEGMPVAGPLAPNMGIFGDPAAWQGRGRTLSVREMVKIISQLNGIDTAGASKQKKPGKVNVTIQRIEVKSDDPDRFAFGLVEALRNVAKNPSAAANAIREG